MRFTALIAGALALALAAPAFAQVVMPGYQSGNSRQAATGVVLLDPSGNPTGNSAAATSTPCIVSATTSAATPTGCTATGSAGTYVVGPFTPQPGYPIRLVTTGTWVGTIAVGTSVDSCATVNALTVAGLTWGSYTGNANEAVDVPPTTGGVKYCLSITVTSGTLSAALRQ